MPAAAGRLYAARGVATTELATASPPAENWGIDAAALLLADAIEQRYGSASWPTTIATAPPPACCADLGCSGPARAAPGYVVPDRASGHDLRPPSWTWHWRRPNELLVTVVNGIANTMAGVLRTRAKGLRVSVTKHHRLPPS